MIGGGSENPGPSLSVFDAGIVFWPGARWGIAVRVAGGPGENLHEPKVFGDRTYFGSGHLRYWTFTARHRRAVTPRWGAEIGFGMMVNGRFDTIWAFNDPGLGRRQTRTSFSGFSFQGLATKTLSRHFGIKGGLAYDFNFETNNLQPIVLGTVRF